jgi:hypothetical protein
MVDPMNIPVKPVRRAARTRPFERIAIVLQGGGGAQARLS